MEEEVLPYSDDNIDVKPINKNCSQNQRTIIVDDNNASKNNDQINHVNNQAKADAIYDNDPQVKPLYGGVNMYGIQNYQINYKKKKFLINTFNIQEALFHLVKSLKIKNDCLFEVKNVNNKKTSIYHFKNNKRKVINKIR